MSFICCIFVENINMYVLRGRNKDLYFRSNEKCLEYSFTITNKIKRYEFLMSRFPEFTRNITIELLKLEEMKKRLIIKIEES